MIIVFHDDFLQTYTSDPAASPGRLNHALSLLKGNYSFVVPQPCPEEDVLLIHSGFHLENVRRNRMVYNMALLAAGATIEAAEQAMNGNPAFALCRPPGHHASPDSCWGFCYFNNVAIAVEKLRREGKVEKVLIIDFDLHFGDGTANAFAGRNDVVYWHVQGRNRISFVKGLRDYLEKVEADLVAVSAGFDRHERDWGGMLTTEDYRKMGEILSRYAREKCQGRLFAALEGGYNARSLGESILAFTEGMNSCIAG